MTFVHKKTCNMWSIGKTKAYLLVSIYYLINFASNLDQNDAVGFSTASLRIHKII